VDHCDRDEGFFEASVRIFTAVVWHASRLIGTR
jgi:hypothetical protein